MTINERFFYLIEKNNISQKKIATDIGISEKTISAWKSRKSDPPANLITAIADYLNISVLFLLTGQETDCILETKKMINDKLTFDEKSLLNTYRELDEDGKTIMLDTSKEIWADHRLPTKSGQSKGKSYLSQKDELIG